MKLLDIEERLFDKKKLRRLFCIYTGIAGGGAMLPVVALGVLSVFLYASNPVDKTTQPQCNVSLIEQKANDAMSPKCSTSKPHTSGIELR